MKTIFQPRVDFWDLEATDRGLSGLQIGMIEREGDRFAHKAVGRRAEILAQAQKELREYLEGERESFEVALDLSAGTPFEQAVWRELLKIPFGAFKSYGEIARDLGKPNAARAVGGAVGRNPLPILVPCHRVLGAQGALGGFSCGLDVKRALLTLEGIRWK